MSGAIEIRKEEKKSLKKKEVPPSYKSASLVPYL